MFTSVRFSEVLRQVLTDLSSTSAAKLVISSKKKSFFSEFVFKWVYNGIVLIHSISFHFQSLAVQMRITKPNKNQFSGFLDSFCDFYGLWIHVQFDEFKIKFLVSCEKFFHFHWKKNFCWFSCQIIICSVQNFVLDSSIDLFIWILFTRTICHCFCPFVRK